MLFMELKLTYEEIKEIRKALGQVIRDIDVLEESERYEIVGELYDRIVNVEIQLEEEEN